MYSSNNDFNDLVLERSTVSKTGFGDYTTVLGDEFEVLKFINDFRANYYGIKDEYNLEFPEETHLEEDNYDTIEDVDEEEDESNLSPVFETQEEEEEEDDGF
jgi:hypothetical protein